MARKRWLRVLALAVPVAAGIGLAIASFDYCGAWPEQPPVVSAVARSSGRLLAGAARIPLSPDLPARPAGYGPFVRSVPRADEPLHARVVVLESGALRVGLVELEVLLIPDALSGVLREDARAHGLDELVVVASHTHTSFGGYDRRLFSQLAGTGPWDRGAQEMIRGAVRDGLARAVAALAPVELEVVQRPLEGWVRSRTDYADVDDALTWVRLHAGGKDVAELLVFAAHPTIVGRVKESLSADYPGALMARLEEDGGVALYLPGVVGNATARVDHVRGAAAYGRGIAELALDGTRSPSTPALAFARATVSLPRPDASRLVPRLFAPATENVLCASTERTSTLSLLQLGTVRLAFVPGEITAPAARLVSEATSATRVISMADGYVGYVEGEGPVSHRDGESLRQYFDAELAARVERSARAAAQALEAAPAGGS